MTNSEKPNSSKSLKESELSIAFLSHITFLYSRVHLVNMSSPSSSLSPNALVLVTGSGGYLGSAISWQLLKKGFKVRGTTRTASKLRLFKEKAETEFGQGKFEIAEIADLSVKGALDFALKGE